MAERGWTVPDWPKEYGGGGLSPAETKILRQEMTRLGARSPLMSFGISMLGPALLKYGTEEQKKRFLTEIARGEIRWCQGYSEPNAGSDLASLQTKCEDKGDHWLVNGQKVWTSYADKATGSSASSAPTSRRPSTRGSASSCSTWRAKASPPSRSSSSPAIRLSARPSSTT
jgi:alkylation response protein AidB-like acyl-CoA dehydrogenase